MNVPWFARQNLIADSLNRGWSAVLVLPSRLRRQIGNRKQRASVRRRSDVYA